jgi:hypothetical protein
LLRLPGRDESKCLSIAVLGSDWCIDIMETRIQARVPYWRCHFSRRLHWLESRLDFRHDFRECRENDLRKCREHDLGQCRDHDFGHCRERKPDCLLVVHSIYRLLQ